MFIGYFDFLFREGPVELFCPFFYWIVYFIFIFLIPIHVDLYHMRGWLSCSRRGYSGIRFPWPAGAISGHEALLQGLPSRAAHRVISKCQFLLGLPQQPL